MPVQQVNLWTCGITGQTAQTPVTVGAPTGWFELNGDWYHPTAQEVIVYREETAANAATPTALTPDQITAQATAAELTACGLANPQNWP